MPYWPSQGARTHAHPAFPHITALPSSDAVGIGRWPTAVAVRSAAVQAVVAVVAALATQLVRPRGAR
jgi:hypothetical protein